MRFRGHVKIQGQGLIKLGSVKKMVMEDLPAEPPTMENLMINDNIKPKLKIGNKEKTVIKTGNGFKTIEPLKFNF